MAAATTASKTTPKKKTEKRCAVCKKTKPLTQFRKHRHSSDGYQYRCKSCAKAYDKSWRANGASSTRTVRTNAKHKLRADHAKRKRCAACKRLRPRVQFNKNAHNPDGLQSDCRACHNPVKARPKGTPPPPRAPEGVLNLGGLLFRRDEAPATTAVPVEVRTLVTQLAWNLIDRQCRKLTGTDQEVLRVYRSMQTTMREA